jgi:hypothetical protein
MVGVSFGRYRSGFRRRGNAVFGLLVLVLVGELAAAVWLSHHPGGGASPPVAVAGDPAPGTTTTVAPVLTTEPPSSTTSVTALSAPITTAGAVTYTVSAGTEARVQAQGKCWMQARRQAGGPVIDDLTLTSGETKSYTAPVWLRFGDSSRVTVTAGTIPLQLPPAPGDLIIKTA